MIPHCFHLLPVQSSPALQAHRLRHIPTVLSTAMANAMQTTHSGRQINAAKLATTTEKSERKTLLAALDENANYLESMANKAAVAAGDVNAGYSLINAIGFQVAGKGNIKRNIGFVASGIGWAHAHEAKTVKGVEGHIWEGGPLLVKVFLQQM